MVRRQYELNFLGFVIRCMRLICIRSVEQQPSIFIVGILNAKHIETDAHLFFFHLRCCYYYYYSAAALHTMMNNQMNNDLTMNHSNLFHFSSPFSLHKIHIAFFVAIGVMGFVCRVYMYYKLSCSLIFRLNCCQIIALLFA